MLTTSRSKPTGATLNFSQPFDDLEVGMEFGGGGRTITEADVVQFAALTGDRHRQHVDADWAAQSQFGGRIAHGLLIVSYAVGMLPLDPDRVIALRRINRATFKRPVRIGETIRVKARVSKLSAVDPGVGLVSCLLSIVKSNDTRAAHAEMELLWRRDDGSTADENTVVTF